VEKITSRAHFYKLLDRPELKQAAAEVGVAEGRYSREILSWGIGKLYLVDLWEEIGGMKGCPSTGQHQQNYDSCLRIVEQFPGRVILLKGWSWEQAKNVPDNSLGLVHLDAHHYYESAVKDLAAWWPKLLPGGVMSGHDYLAHEYTVRQAVDEFATARKIEVLVDRPDDPRNASFYFRKPPA